jgi:uncharacterized membrane protein
MNKLLNYIKVTLAGGVFFFIPVVVLSILIAKAIQVLWRIVEPIAPYLPFSEYIGAGIETILTIILLLFFCFLGGLLMRTAFAKKIIQLLEENVLMHIPAYSYLKVISTDQFGEGDKNTWKPASVFIDDNEVICFVIDESENYCSIFLPSAPSPSSGSVCVREKSMVRYLPLTVKETIMMIRHFGKGAAAIMEKAKPVTA